MLLLLVDILLFRFVIKFSILESLGWIVFLFLQVSPCYYFCYYDCYCYCFSGIATVVSVGKRMSGTVHWNTSSWLCTDTW